ncbi:MAG: hypothetical protein ABJB03_09630 [Rhodoglobus sp.]
MSTNVIETGIGQREWWEVLSARIREGIARHPVAARRVRRTVVIIQLSFIVLALPTMLLVSATADQVGWVLVELLPLAILFWLARTKTIGWKLVSVVFTASMLFAPFVATVELWAGQFWGAFSFSNGISVGIAGFFEEAGKLIPLAVLAIVATGRVRRFATVDWMLVGYACGAGFAATEQAARATQYTHPSIGLALAIADGVNLGPVVSVNPFLVASSDNDSGLSPGHAVWTAFIAGSIGIGIYLWRRYRGTRARWFGWALPLLAAHAAISDHMLYNASGNAEAGDTWGFFGLPWTSTLSWFALGRGYGVPILAFLVFLVALALDVERRRAAAASAAPGVIYPARVGERTARVRAWAAAASGFAGMLRRAGAIAATAWFQWSADVVPALQGYRRRAGEHWRSAQTRGRVAITAAQSARRVAMRRTVPAGSARRFRLTAAVVTVAGLLVAFLAGLVIANLLGNVLSDPNDAILPWKFIGGLLYDVQGWWNHLPLWAQGLVTLTAVSLIFLSGGTLAAGFLWSGVGTYSLGHANDLYLLGTDPKGSIKYYLLNTSPGDMLADAVELGFTALPIHIGPKGDIGDLTTYFGGEVAGAYTDQFRGDGPSINDLRLGIRRELDGIVNQGSSTPPLQTRAPGSFEASRLDLPTHDAAGTLPAPHGDELVVGRPDLNPNTAYDVPGRGTYYTNADGRVSIVVESHGGSIAPDLDHASSGVLYVENNGFAYGLTDDGGLWATIVRLPD